ncbi:MAG: glycosyltransferase family 2 protein, partial [Caldisericum sp.]|uniref:glycosyltransferase family 2 protein n=1 Tax=Caldisericum sp. TaxID=2499687 RepID=UPI003D119048
MNLELKDNNGEQKISIIIPTYNNGESLFRLLNSIEKNKTNYEIIAIDKFSTDNTKEYCENFKVKLFQSNFLRSKAKNFGASMASSKYILFLDSDMEISENLLDIILDKLKEYDALCIKE